MKNNNADFCKVCRTRILTYILHLRKIAGFFGGTREGGYVRVRIHQFGGVPSHVAVIQSVRGYFISSVFAALSSQFTTISAEPSHFLSQNYLHCES